VRRGCNVPFSVRRSDANFPLTMPTRNSLAHFGLRLVAATCLVAAGAAGSHAQSTAPISMRNASRAQIDSVAGYLDRMAASTAYGAALRERARSEAVAMRRRLTEGDFKPGDRIILHIEGAITLDDTATVLEGRRLPVEGFRQVSLEGVLRSELEARLRNDLTDFVRNAVVTVRPLMRVAVFGSVARQGYLLAPSETTIDDLLTLAGGPGADSNVREMLLQRGDTTIVSSEQLRLYVANGSTIGAIGLEDGDALFIPQRQPPRDFQRILQTGSFLFSMLSVILVRF
jgi:protein involved in polysaccharide export with SLBB domain